MGRFHGKAVFVEIRVHPDSERIFTLDLNASTFDIRSSPDGTYDVHIEGHAPVLPIDEALDPNR